MERSSRSVDPEVLGAAGRAAASRHGHAVVSRILALCESRPEQEACGVVLSRGAAREVVEVPNVADRFHAAHPQLHPRTSRDGYVMEPHSLLRIHRALASGGGRVVAVWHSHVDGSAAFSAQDSADALVDGAPVLPGVEYIVVGLRGGRAREVRVYRFDGSEFVDAVGSSGERTVR